MSIGNVILDLRSERGISQKVLAEAIGVGQSTIAQIELNRNEATAATIRKIANFFGVSADYLLGLENDYGAKIATPMGNAMGESLTTEERDLIAKYRSLSPDLKEMLNGIIGTWTGGTEPTTIKKKV